MEPTYFVMHESCSEPTIRFVVFDGMKYFLAFHVHRTDYIYYLLSISSYRVLYLVLPLVYLAYISVTRCRPFADRRIQMLSRVSDSGWNTMATWPSSSSSKTGHRQQVHLRSIRSILNYNLDVDSVRCSAHCTRAPYRLHSSYTFEIAISYVFECGSISQSILWQIHPI